MSELLGQPLPTLAVALVLVGISASSALLSRARARGSWFAPAVSLASAFLAISVVFIPVLTPQALRAQVLVQRVAEIPFVSLIAGLCMAKAGLLPSGSRRGMAPSPEVAARPWTKRALRLAPVALLSGWLLALAGQMVWPAPVLQVYAQATPSYFFVLFPTAIPLLFYISLLGWLFYKAAGRHVPSARLRVKNFSYSAGIFSYAIMVVSDLAQVAVASFLADGPRQEVTTLLLALQDRLMLVIAIAIPLGLALGVAPALGGTLTESVLPALLGRDRFEARRWQLTAIRRVRKPSRVLRYASEAARVLGLSERDRAKALATVELAAALADSSDGRGEFGPEGARELLALHERAASGEAGERLMLDHTGPEEAPVDRHPGQFREVLSAALALVGRDDGHHHDADPSESLWRALARVACEDARQGPLQRLSDASQETLAYRRARRAYEAAKELGRTTTA